MFRKLTDILSLPHLLSDPRFAPRRRVENRQALNQAIEAVTATRSSEHWVEAFNAAGIPCGPVNSIDEVFRDPQVVHSGIARPVDHPALGALTLVGQPIDICGVDSGLRQAAPDPGQHSREILTEYGFAPAEIARLFEAGVVV
jgi:formyl-CoA transferase